MIPELLWRGTRAATVDADGLSACPRERARLLDAGADHAVLAVVGGRIAAVEERISQIAGGT